MPPRGLPRRSHRRRDPPRSPRTPRPFGTHEGTGGTGRSPTGFTVFSISTRSGLSAAPHLLEPAPAHAGRIRGVSVVCVVPEPVSGKAAIDDSLPAERGPPLVLQEMPLGRLILRGT